MYAPLWCKSNFSFLEGASHPAELVMQAHHLGLTSLALTDRDGVYGVVRAHLAANETGLQLLIGAQVTVARTLSDATSQLLLIAQDRVGYGQLCQLLSSGRLRCQKGASMVTWSEVCAHAKGLIALWGGEASLLCGSDEP